tara:strand:- start:18 stop:983 length:966 start_codon:yes stop_codon:yes gene_type:complete
MPTKIQLRRDTAADWTSNNPTLAAGEFGWESDTNRFKIGDGSAAWNSLGYADTLKTLGDLAVTGSTISAPSNGDLTLTTAGSGKVNISTAYTLPSSDGSANQVLQTNGSGTLSFADQSGGGSSLGDLTAIGSTLTAPSNADLTLVSSNGNVVIEGIRVAGTTLSTEDSSPGIEIAGNLIPSQDGVFQLGSQSRRWQTAYLAAETIDLGGATIKSDGSGELTIAATGATLPVGSKVVDQAIVLGGKTNKTSARPTQIVKLFVSDGSSNFSDAQLLAKTADLELEFNGTVEDVPVYTDAQQTFTLATGDSLATNAAGITLFQF